MGKNIIYFGLLVLCALETTKGDYVGAVLEYSPEVLGSANETISENLKSYVIYIEQARDSGVQIIVFPEYGLTGNIRDPTNYAIEIPNTGSEAPYANNVLETLSNAAQSNNMYIVFNIAEKAKTANNDTIYYNTNVVFGKDRKIIAKYRKINLFNEDRFTSGDVEENKRVTFVTDFGVTFGTFICFDMAFNTPSVTVLNNSVTDIVYPTEWFSTLPFYHSLSFQYGYAVTNRVNVLAANLNNASEGVGGSGIYGADGTIYNYFLSGASSANKLIVATVRTSVFGTRALPDPDGFGFDMIEGVSVNDVSNYNIARSFDSSNYRFHNVDTSKVGNVSQEICYGEFCCQFYISVNSTNSTAVYKLMAFRGVQRLSSTVNSNIKVCSLLACETDDVSTCATKKVKNTAQFSNITITARVENDPEHSYSPITLTTQLLPVFNTTYRANVENDTRAISLTTGKNEDKVLVFAIYSNGASRFGVSGAVFVVLFALFKFLY